MLTVEFVLKALNEILFQGLLSQSFLMSLTNLKFNAIFMNQCEPEKLFVRKQKTWEWWIFVVFIIPLRILFVNCLNEVKVAFLSVLWWNFILFHVRMKAVSDSKLEERTKHCVFVITWTVRMVVRRLKPKRWIICWRILRLEVKYSKIYFANDVRFDVKTCNIL